MAQERRAMEEENKTGGQRGPQLMTNTRTSYQQTRQQANKNQDVFKNRVARMRIENDLYERQSS